VTGVTLRDQLTAACPHLSLGALERLGAMYSAERLQGTTGECEVGATKVSIEEGASIHHLIRASGARRTLEIGFAFGFSSVWILDALPAGGAHRAIDPYEEQIWGGVGLRQVGLLGASANFEWIRGLSIHALSDDIRRAAKYDFVFIDGNHRFDDVLVDFYLADQVLAVGGTLAFDDMWMPSVRTVAAFVQANRAYSVIPQPAQNMLALRKERDDDRDWQHYVPFLAHAPRPQSA
jgi:predicted O-methyltransferase YrrM